MRRPSPTMVLAVLAVARAVAAAPATIRTGGPSFAGDAKHAVVLGRKSMAGKPFTVTDDAGSVVLESALVRAAGKAKPWKTAAIADLTPITTPGSYRVAAGRLQSEPWVVVGDASATSSAVRHILRFFAVNSDGNEPSPVHGPAHLNDATVVGGSLDGQHVDLTGGWMNAGDTLKFTQTTSFAVAALLVAARLDAADAAALREAAGVGVRWLLKAHPAPDVFVSQVGEIVSDHDRDPASGFDPAEDDASPLAAIAQRQALTGIGWDSGGRTAAALALAAQSAPDMVRRDALIAAAIEWYEAANQTAGLAPPLPEEPYPSSTGLDDMALGAVELFHATGDAQYAADATDWLDGHELSGSITWDDVGALAAAELCGVAGLPAPSPEASSRGCPLLLSAGQIAADNAARGPLATAGTLAFGTTAEHGGGGAVLALAAAAGFASGRALAADARDWVLGRNAWGRSFVAGLGPGAPTQIHHRAVTDGPAAFAGAVVGGPTSLKILRQEKLRFRKTQYDGPAGAYEDRIGNYVTSEVALDYAASTILLFAALAPPE